MADVKIRLLHSSSHPAASGSAGDEITCSEPIANRFIEGNGAELIAVISEPEPAKRASGRRKAKNTDGD